MKKRKLCGKQMKLFQVNGKHPACEKPKGHSGEHESETTAWVESSPGFYDHVRSK